MDRRKWEIAFAVALILGLIALVLFLFLRKDSPAPAPAPAQNEATLPAGNAAPTITDAPQPVLDPGVRDAPMIARLFVERFGSYSSEANRANIDDVLSLATPAFQAELQATKSSSAVAGEYYGVSTRVLSATVTENTETTATINVMTQRAETVGAADEAVRYQDVTVQMEKVNDTWKVRAITWK